MELIYIILSTVLLTTIKAEENTNTTKKNERYEPELLLSKIFNPNNTTVSRRAGYGLIKFEGQTSEGTNDHNYGLITFEDQPAGHPLKFAENLKDTPNLNPEYSGAFGPEGTGVTFQDDNRIEGQNVQGDTGEGQKQKKRKRRRRRPRLQQGHPGYPGIIPGIPVPQGQNPYLNHGFYRPHRRPRPSRASEALAAVTGALSSIALYDDYQCVPRLLCEAAGGGALGAAGSSGVLQSIAGLQPLLVLLSAYNGISTSPLFVFGRAVFLGMTSKANPGTCRYAYPLCPTDPEQLVHYLNNHNGGFFRFFSAPQLPNPQYGLQNLEQFYNQLGQYGPSNGPEQNYGLYQPGTEPSGQPNPAQPNYGLYNNLPNQIPDYGFQRPNLYNGHQQNYGSNYPYDQNKYGFQHNRFKNSEEFGDYNKRIQKRIQNKRPDNDVDDNFDSTEQNPKWLFPEDVNGNNDYNINNNFINYKVVKYLRFPEDAINVENDVQTVTNRKARGFIFPGIQSNREIREYIDYFPNPPVFNNDVFKFGQGNRNTEIQNDAYRSMQKEEEDGVEIVYVVRGNGDPNNPEIVKLKQGQTIK